MFQKLDDFFNTSTVMFSSKSFICQDFFLQVVVGSSRVFRRFSKSLSRVFSMVFGSSGRRASPRRHTFCEFPRDHRSKVGSTSREACGRHFSWSLFFLRGLFLGAHCSFQLSLSFTCSFSMKTKRPCLCADFSFSFIL